MRELSAPKACPSGQAGASAPGGNIQFLIESFSFLPHSVDNWQSTIENHLMRFPILSHRMLLSLSEKLATGRPGSHDQ